MTSADGTVIGSTRHGDGPRVILVGGGLDDGTENAPLAAALAAHRAQLIPSQLRAGTTLLRPERVAVQAEVAHGLGARREVFDLYAGAAHVTQSWSTCSDGDDHASRNGEKQ